MFESSIGPREMLSAPDHQEANKSGAGAWRAPPSLLGAKGPVFAVHGSEGSLQGP